VRVLVVLLGFSGVEFKEFWGRIDFQVVGGGALCGGTLTDRWAHARGSAQASGQPCPMFLGKTSLFPAKPM